MLFYITHTAYTLSDGSLGLYCINDTEDKILSGVKKHFSDIKSESNVQLNEIKCRAIDLSVALGALPGSKPDIGKMEAAIIDTARKVFES